MVISDVRNGKFYRLPPESAYITKLNCNNHIMRHKEGKKLLKEIIWIEFSVNARFYLFTVGSSYLHALLLMYVLLQHTVGFQQHSIKFITNKIISILT